jgi:hypothetical protein
MPTVTQDKPEPISRRGRYPKEYGRDVCSLVMDQKRSVASVAKAPGLSDFVNCHITGPAVLWCKAKFRKTPVCRPLGRGF